MTEKKLISGQNTVQFVYLAVACAGLAVNILFIFTRLPEVSEEVLQAMAAAEAGDASVDADKPFYKQFNCIFAFIAQFAYVGAQVTVATFFLNYTNEVGGVARVSASASS